MESAKFFFCVHFYTTYHKSRGTAMEHTLGPNSTNHLCMRTTNFLMDEDDEVQNEHIRSDKK